MKRILVAFLLVLLLPSFLSAKQSDFTKASPSDALIDCMSASIVSYYSGVVLPDSTMAVFADSNLPARISYFLADPYEFISTIETKLGTDSVKRFFSQFFKPDDSVLAAYYNKVGSRKYKEFDYLISGSIMFSYEEGTSQETITSLWANRATMKNPITIEVDCTISGKAVPEKITVKGSFLASVTESGEIAFNSIGEYSVNAYTLFDGVYYY